MNHPTLVMKYVHKSKINAVKIADWQDHHDIATVPYVYTYNGEESEGAKYARLFTAAPELLDALESCYSELNQLAFMSGDKLASITLRKAQDAIQKAKGE